MNGPIVIVGMPRSGTTWIGKLFDSHPDTLYRHEPDSVRHLHIPAFPPPEDAWRYKRELVDFVSALPCMRSAKVVGKRPLFAKRYQSRVGFFAYRSSVLAAKVAGRVFGDLPCPYRPTVQGCCSVQVVWKSIESVGRLAAITAALPNAHVIHIMRHPCGYVASMLRGDREHKFSQRTPSADDHWVLKLLLAANRQHPDASLDDLKQLEPDERLAWRWVLTQEKIRADVGACPRVLTVRYEDVCADPFAMTQRMFDFAGLRWSPQTESFIRRGEQSQTGGYYSVVKRAQVAAERWRSELPPASVARVQAVLQLSALRRWYASTDASTATPAQEAMV